MAKTNVHARVYVFWSSQLVKHNIISCCMQFDYEILVRLIHVLAIPTTIIVVCFTHSIKLSPSIDITHECTSIQRNKSKIAKNFGVFNWNWKIHPFFNGFPTFQSIYLYSFDNNSILNANTLRFCEEKN